MFLYLYSIHTIIVMQYLGTFLISSREYIFSIDRNHWKLLCSIENVRDNIDFILFVQIWKINLENSAASARETSERDLTCKNMKIMTPFC